MSLIFKICSQSRWKFRSERAGNNCFFSNGNVNATPTLGNGINFCGTNKLFQTRLKVSSAKFGFFQPQKNLFSSKVSRETKSSNGVSQKLILLRYSITIVIVIEASYKKRRKANYNHGQIRQNDGVSRLTLKCLFISNNKRNQTFWIFPTNRLNWLSKSTP